MKTNNEIVEFLEKELVEAEEMLEKYNYVDNEKATQYLIMANQLNYILEEIDVDGNVTHQEPEVAKILVETPKEQNAKNSPKDIYIKVFALITFVLSWFFIDDLIYKLIDEFDFIEGIWSALFHYGYLVLHGFSCFLVATHTPLINTNKKHK